MHKKNPNVYFNKHIALQYGVDNAILIHHFQYSIGQNKRNKIHFYEGRYWAYASLRTLVALYPFWTKRILERIIRNLKKEEVLITGNFNKNSYDRTTWFAFKDEQKFICG